MTRQTFKITVQFFSYFRDLAGCHETKVEIRSGSTLGDLFEEAARQHPRLAPMRNSTLMAVGVEYEPKDYVVKIDDAVSFFPPVQGG
jgi:molybdopterin converting factor small subunit